MKQIIYVDVLIIINIYINYGLLLLTAYIVKRKAERLKILLSSLLGGIYSLIILIPDISEATVSFSRIPALLLMVFLGIGYINRKQFIKATAVFFGVNLAFAGAMLLTWFFVCPENMYFSSGIVYFSIDAFALIVMTVIAYTVIRIIAFFGKNRCTGSFTYKLSFVVSDKEITCRGYYDSGNSLCDPFSGEGVIIADAELFKEIISADIFDDFEDRSDDVKVKLIPVRSVTGMKLLPSFRADSVKIEGLETDMVLEKPVVALCREKIHSGEYGALLYSSVFDNSLKGLR